MIIGSIAPAYRPDKRIRGHEVSFQTDLRAAALARGAAFHILVPTEAGEPGAAGPDGVVACLPDRKDPARCLVGVRQWLAGLGDGDETVVLLYEGGLQWLAAFDALAAEHPRVHFIVNLFFPEPALNTPSTSVDALVQPVPVRVREEENRAAATAAFRPSPQRNVTVLAETEERRFLAQAIGVPAVGTWPLHSQLAVPSTPTRSDASMGRLRVLIPLAPRQIKPRVMRDIEFITRQVDRATDERQIDWTIAGPLARDRQAMRSLSRVLRPGLTLHPEELEPDEYAALFLAHDAVWFPIRGHYTTQSSGKTLDALVTATPIIAPAGSYAAKQQQRWLPGAPAYDGSREAIELLVRLPTLAPSWRRALIDRSSAIRAAYSATEALAALLEVVTGSDGTRATTSSVSEAEREQTRPSLPTGRVQKHRMRVAEALDRTRAFLRFLRR
jgi:hypothetical protein